MCLHKFGISNSKQNMYVTMFVFSHAYMCMYEYVYVTNCKVSRTLSEYFFWVNISTDYQECSWNAENGWRDSMVIEAQWPKIFFVCNRLCRSGSALLSDRTQGTKKQWCFLFVFSYSMYDAAKLLHSSGYNTNLFSIHSDLCWKLALRQKNSLKRHQFSCDVLLRWECVVYECV